MKEFLYVALAIAVPLIGAAIAIRVLSGALVPLFDVLGR